MKKLLLLLLVFPILLASCNKESTVPTMEIPLTTSLTASDIDLIGFQLKSYVNAKYILTRANPDNILISMADDSEAIKIFKPLVEDGSRIVQQINKEPELLTVEDEEFYNSLTDDQLAVLSLIAVAYGYISEEMYYTRAIDWNRVRSCAAFALGVSQVKELAIKGVVTATTVRAAVVAIGKRYLGYAGVALMVWDFYDCFN